MDALASTVDDKRSPSPTPAARQRVLIAEDNEITQDFLRVLLTRDGFQVDVVGDGREALRALRSKSYDVVLLDFHLPHLDGLQVANAFRPAADGKAPRFIAITADVKGLMARTESTGPFDRVIPKPFDAGELSRLIGR